MRPEGKKTGVEQNSGNTPRSGQEVSVSSRLFSSQYVTVTRVYIGWAWTQTGQMHVVPPKCRHHIHKMRCLGLLVLPPQNTVDGWLKVTIFISQVLEAGSLRPEGPQGQLLVQGPGPGLQTGCLLTEPSLGGKREHWCLLFF